MFALLNATELKFATTKNVGELNPHLYSPNEMFAQNMVYEGFVAYFEDNKIIPALATSWDISKDGLVYTFYLRKGVKFSNGKDFNANAVKINFDTLLKDKDTHNWSALMNALDKVLVVDDYTVKIHLKHIYEPTLRELFGGALVIENIFAYSGVGRCVELFIIVIILLFKAQKYRICSC